MKILRYCLFAAAALQIAACSSTLKPAQLNENGYFETSTLLSENEVSVSGPFKPEYAKLLFVKTDEKNTKLNTFYVETFNNMQRFEKVMTKDDVEALDIEQGLADRVSNISDKIGLYSLSKEIGPFLVVEPYVEYQGGYDFIATLKAFDPTEGKYVIELENKAFNWAGLDKPLFYPLFNAFLDWTRGEEIRTKKEAASGASE